MKTMKIIVSIHGKIFFIKALTLNKFYILILYVII